jgi:photosystem II stability/assembly factor-like uncharacterized protein
MVLLASAMALACGSQATSVGPSENSNNDAGMLRNDAGALRPDGAAGSPDASIDDASRSYEAGGPLEAGAQLVDASSVPDAPPHIVSPCGDAGTTGSGGWENITPAGVTKGLAIAIDPQDTATVYYGTAQQGLYKTTDCGATWTKFNTLPGGTLDQGMEGSIAIDPVDRSIYLDNRYGNMGVFKSTNGGQDFAQVLPPDIAQAFVDGGMVEWIAIDPTDHLHVLVTPHFSCMGSAGPNCALETKDGGQTWTVLPSTPPSGELGGQVMLDSTNWLWADQGGGPQGLWRSSNAGGGAAGGGWGQPVYTGGVYPYLVRGPDGTFYMPGQNSGVIESSDRGITWSVIANSNLAESIAASAQSMFTSGGLNANLYSRASFTDPHTWTTMPGPAGATDGGWMLQYDNDHGLLYSSTFASGLWRLSTQ